MVAYAVRYTKILSMNLSSKHQAVLSRAKQDKYLITSSRGPAALKNSFYHWCEENKYPCIQVSTGYKYADIDICLDATEKVFTDNTKSIIRSIYQKYINKKAPIESSKKDFFLVNIPIEDIESLVKELIPFLPFD